MSITGRKIQKRSYDLPGISDEIHRNEYDEEKHVTFDYDTEGLKLHCKTMYEAAKAVHTFGEKVQEKLKKSKSKHLEKYKEKYTTNLEALKEEIPFIDGVLNKKKRKIERTQSDAGKLKPHKCHECDKKDREIISLRMVQESIKQSHGSKREVPTQQEGEIASLKDGLRKETQAKEEYVKQLDTLMKTHVHKDEMKREIEMLRQQNDRLRQQCSAEKEAKDDALQRLSNVASSRLRDNNPNITDLSDQNRPTKIAEKLSELYDNEWTDAFDVLEKQNKGDMEIIDMLRKSLMNVYHECSKLANENFFENVQSVIECPKNVFKQSPPKLEMSQQLMREIKEFRKFQAPKVIKEIEKIVLSTIDHNTYQSKDIGKFLSKCIEIGWLMVVQDPPLELLEEAPDRFDTNTFKEYTSRGRFTEYVVWPALLLHKDGPLLAKGVAQGCGHSIKSQSLGRSQKVRRGNNTRMVGTFTARKGDKRPAVNQSTFRSPDNDIVTHV